MSEKLVRFLGLGLVVVGGLVGCGDSGATDSGSTTGPTASTTGGGSSSGSSGSSTSGGSTGGGLVNCDVDGGPSCGTAELGVDSAEVAANPHNVLSAVVQVKSHGASSLSVQVLRLSDGTLVATPSVAATGGTQTLPVLGLTSHTDYQLQVLASDADGNPARSAILHFTSGILPVGMQTFTATTTGAVQPGFVTITKLNVGGSASPAMIVDRDGQVVWYSGQSPVMNGDFQKQPDGTYTLGVAAAYQYPQLVPSEFRQIDALGNLLASYTVPDGSSSTDNHEFRILPDGDLLALGMTSVTADMTGYDGGANAVLVGDKIIRMHPDGGSTFETSFFDDFQTSDIDVSITKAGASVDAIHANSLDVTSDGDYLVSSRHLSQIRKYDAQTGAVVWKLGGVRSDFTFVNDPLNGFSMQHFARELSPNDILLFDDGNEHTPPRSRAVEYQLDLATMTATLVWSYTPSPSVFSFAMGSAQRLPNGDTLIDYGTASRIDEVDAEGNLVWQLTDSSPKFGFYRALSIDSLY